MPFQVSPGVNVSEIDLTTVVPAVSTTEGALAGVFRWGSVGERVLVDSETNLTARFGKPTNHNAETFFVAANFLSYGNKLYVTRVANTTSTNTGILCRNAIANTAAVASFTVDADTSDTENALYVVKNDDHFATIQDTLTGSTADDDVKFIAKYPGALGNSLKVSTCFSQNAFSSNLLEKLYANVEAQTIDSGVDPLESYVAMDVGSANLTIAVGVSLTGSLAVTNAVAAAMRTAIVVGDIIPVGNSVIGTQNMKVVSVGNVFTQNATGGTSGNTHSAFVVQCEETFGLSANVSIPMGREANVANATVTLLNTVKRNWEYADLVDAAPGISTYQANFGNTTTSQFVDEMHAVVIDEDGMFTGIPGTILEVFAGLSRATDAKTEDGSTNYYKTVINQNSNYVWTTKSFNDAAVNTAVNLTQTGSTAEKPSTLSFIAGLDGEDETALSIGTILSGYDLYASAEDVDVSLLLTGKSRGGTNGEQIANYLIDNIAEKRKDCVVFVSPQREDLIGDAGDEISNIVTFRNSLRSTSYAVLDSGYKYQYDKYNDIYRWIPLNGDIAGLCVRTDDTRDPWFSPAGFNRGQIKNIVKLAYNPRQADRDILYKAGVNPVVTFPGQGTVLYGDKTLLAKPSAFDRINVRRLFIVLEKAIATAAKFTLFEFNDDFTRAQFRNLVEPFLRDVQGRRGIYDFQVVCDTTNNTGEVIDRNEFIGDIYIKPAKSINFIQLNFVAVRTGVEFSEVVGQF